MDKNKYEQIKQLLYNTAVSVSGNAEDWTNFLVSASQVYKYNFSEQILIYAQRPDATACAGIDVWNGRMNRWVDRGAKGIALLDNDSIRYVFDVADTYAAGNGRQSRMPYRWAITKDNEQEIVHRLKKELGENIKGNSLFTVLHEASISIVEENISDWTKDLSRQDSFLEELDEATVTKEFRTIAQKSIEFLVLYRCGYNVNEYMDLTDFEFVKDFNTIDTITQLGTAVSDSAEHVLRRVEKSARELELQKRKARDNQGGKKLYSDQEKTKNIWQNSEWRNNVDFKAQLEEVLNGDRKEPLVLGETPNSLAIAGANKELPLVMNVSTVRKCMSVPHKRYHGHDLSREIMERLPQELRTPALILKGSHDNSLVAITEMIDKENREIMIAVSLSEKQGFREINRLSSAYGRNNMPNYLKTQIEQGNLIAANKEKAERMLHSLGLQLPQENTFISFNNSIAYTTKNVKYPDKKEYDLKYGSLGNGIMVYNRAEEAFNGFRELAHISEDGNIRYYTELPDNVKAEIEKRADSQKEYFEESNFIRILRSVDRFDNMQLESEYVRLKKENLDSLVIFHVGNHFETYGADAQTASEILNIRTGEREALEITGFYEEMLDKYMKELQNDGCDVVIAEPDENGGYHVTREQEEYVAALQDIGQDNVSKPDNQDEYPPIYDNYLQLKAEHEDELLLFRLGDFYELFNDDALHAAEVLELVLTSRDNGVERVPMCGFPQHTLDRYVEKLVQHGFDVAVAEVGEAGQRKVMHVYSETFEITKDMYQTDTADIFVVPDNKGVLARIDLTPSEELFTHLEEYGVTRTEDSQSRILLDTDGKQWNKLVIPDKWGNLTNNIDAAEFLTQTEYAVMLEIAHAVIGAAYNEHTTKIEETSPVHMPENFHITDDHLGAGGLKTKFKNNIEAIKTLQLIEQENRYATPEEQEVLSRYIGWGGMPQAFDGENSDWGKEYTELKGLLSANEYSAARSSTLSAFYTSPTVIKGIYAALSDMGFTTGNILEPSCGVGNFFGLLPEEMSDSKLYGVELDSISGRIAKQLYPNADIKVQGFEETELPDNFFDVVIGNVPFGDIKVNDKRYNKYNFNIHDYFIAKSLDKVRAGGVVAVIASKGVMDKKNPSVRKYIAQRAELLGAIRLPNSAFKENAGTEVVSDILFFQKRDRIIELEPDWIFTSKTDGGLEVNQYFAEHPEMVMGKLEKGINMYGAEDVICVPDISRKLSEQLSDALKNINSYILEATLDEVSEKTETYIPATPDVRNFSYTLVDGDIYFRENSLMKKMEVPKTTHNRIKGMIELRDCARTLIDMQVQEYSEGEIKKQQKKLNKLYDNFSAKYGLINDNVNMRAFREDSSYSLLTSLEVIDENGKLKRKGDLFSKRTIKAYKPVTSVDTASEALTVSIGEKARIDMDFMSELTGKDEQKLFSELKGVIFLNPLYDETSAAQDKYLPADEYLSGNVREKLRFAEARAEKEPEFAVNVDALSKVIPKDLTAAEISVRLGASWIDPKYIDQFMFELFDTPKYSQWNIKTHYSQYTSEWRIENKNSDSNNVKASITYGTNRINAYQILENSLNLNDVKIYDRVVDDAGKEYRVLNQKETTLAQEKQQVINNAFSDWIFKDIDRRNDLVKLYNEKFNSIRPREYDGSHMIFPGMNAEIQLRTHQTSAIAHTIYGGNTLLAHEVGAGKSFEMIASAMESKRLGLCSKSLFVVPNHLTEQMGADVLRLYPSANILVATRKDFTKENRRRLCAKIATGDFDIVIIGHSQLEKIPLSINRQKAFINKEIDNVEKGIIDLKRHAGERFQIKQLEKTKRNLNVKLAKLNDVQRDDVVTFEELGVDRLYVDEAHYFKNAYFYTKMNNVAGIAQNEAQKSADLMMKCRYMDELTGGKGIVFATATPISNSMVEIYTMMNYLQHDTLVKMGWQHFDAWAANFGETVTKNELAPEGTGYRPKTRFARFFNLPELMSVFKECADIKTADMLNLPVPKAHFHNIVAEPTEKQKDMVSSLAERAKKIHNKEVGSSTDNMLCVTNDGRKIGLDQRLVNPMLPDEEGTKVNMCIDNVFKIWKETYGNRSTQLIFCDYSTPKGDGSFNVYDDIRDKLVKRGVPKEEVVFIHEAKTEAQRNELFSKMRNGAVRVLIGSTVKCGTGMNVQDKLIALHDLDAPWRPSDLQQRMGRIVRQGNENHEVDIFRYVTNATFDAYLWQTIENKQRFISQIMTSKAPVRSCEDADETTLSYAEVKALCAGDKRIKEKMDLEVDVAKLKLMKAQHMNQQYTLQDSVQKYLPERIASTKERISGFENDMHYLQMHAKSKDEFSPMRVLNGEYTEKADAGKAILAACKMVKDTNEVKIGKYMGFDMWVKFDGFRTEYTMYLKRSMKYEVRLGNDAEGNITRINNVLGSIGVRLNDSNAQIENLRVQLENAKSELDKPFPKEEELNNKLVRLDELNNELTMDDSVQPEKEKVKEKSVKSDIEIVADKHTEDNFVRIEQNKSDKEKRPSVLEKLQKNQSIVASQRKSGLKERGQNI